MATLAEQLRTLCVRHDLTCVSVHVHNSVDTGKAFFSASVHAAGHGCVNSDPHPAPEDAIADALSDMNIKRGRTAAVPLLVAA